MMENLKFYCLKHSRLADKGIHVLIDINCVEQWEDYWENFKYSFKKLPLDYNFPNFDLDKEKKPLLDFHFVHGLLILSEEAKEVLEDLILPSCQILPFHEIKGKPHFAVHCFKPLDCIDYQKSRFDYYPSSPEIPLNRGEPLYFIEEKVPENISFFKVPLADSSFYCKKEFVERVIEHKLTGLGFRDPRVHELSAISGSAENPVPEVEKFKLNKVT